MEEISGRIRSILKRYQFPDEDEIKQLKERITRLSTEVDELKKQGKKRFLRKISSVIIIVLSLDLFITPSTTANNSTTFTDRAEVIFRYSSGKLNDRLDRNILSSIMKNSKRFNLDPYLVICIIEVESSFRPYVVSKKGAVGLMQVKPSVANAIADKVVENKSLNLFDPEHNITLGTYYLSQLRGNFHDLETALIAYNIGPTKVKKSLLKNVKLSSRYVNKIKACYKKFTFNQ